MRYVICLPLKLCIVGPNAQKLYILGNGQFIHMCMPNASRIFRNHRPITLILLKIRSQRFRKKSFSKVKTIASINLNVEHEPFINEYRRIGHLFEWVTKNKQVKLVRLEPRVFCLTV